MQRSKKITRICSIFGSPHKDGSSSRIHDSFLSLCSGVHQERFYTSDMRIFPCTGCLRCSDGFSCPLPDDMNQLYSAITGADLVTFSFPLYFSSLPGAMKNAVDRCNLLWQRKRLGRYSGVDQQGIYFCTAGAEYKDMFTPSSAVLSHLMNSLGGKLRKDLCLGVSGLDTESGKENFENLCSDQSLFLSRIAALQNHSLP